MDTSYCVYRRLQREEKTAARMRKRYRKRMRFSFGGNLPSNRHFASPPLGGRGGNAPFPTRHKAGTPLWAAPCFSGIPRPDHTGTQGFPIRPGLPRFPEAQAGNSSFPCGRAPRLPARARDSLLTVYQTLPPIATGDRRKWRIFSRFSPFSQGRAGFLPPSRPGGAFRRENLAAPGGIVLE